MLNIRIRKIADDIAGAHHLGTHRENTKFTDIYPPEDKALVVWALLLVARALETKTVFQIVEDIGSEQREHLRDTERIPPAPRKSR